MNAPGQVVKIEETRISPTPRARARDLRPLRLIPHRFSRSRVERSVGTTSESVVKVSRCHHDSRRGEGEDGANEEGSRDAPSKRVQCDERWMGSGSELSAAAPDLRRRPEGPLPSYNRRTQLLANPGKVNRGDRIRTCDLVLPKHPRYQAAPRPVEPTLPHATPEACIALIPVAAAGFSAH